MTQIGDIITNENPEIYTGTAIWCNENNAVLTELEPEGSIRRFQVVAIPEPTSEERNEQIRLERQFRFTNEADPLKFDYDEAVARGEISQYEKKELWLAKKDQIRKELPYVETIAE